MSCEQHILHRGRTILHEIILLLFYSKVPADRDGIGGAFRRVPVKEQENIRNIPAYDRKLLCRFIDCGWGVLIADRSIYEISSAAAFIDSDQRISPPVTKMRHPANI